MDVLNLFIAQVPKETVQPINVNPQMIRLGYFFVGLCFLGSSLAKVSECSIVQFLGFMISLFLLEVQSC